MTGVGARKKNVQSNTVTTKTIAVKYNNNKKREACATNGDELVDLTDGDQPWRGYLAAHAHAYVIIGMGVIRFEARYLDALEPNRRKMNLPGPGGHDGLLGQRPLSSFFHRSTLV